MIEILASKLSRKRLAHSLGVCQTAEHLARKFGVDITKARIAGLLHDCGRAIPNASLLEFAERIKITIDEVSKQEPVLLHAPIGAYIAYAEYGIRDEEILQSIDHHTVGAKNMTCLDKIIYIADMIEPLRSYQGVDIIRNQAELNIDAALLSAYDQSIQLVILRKGLLHPATMDGRNQLLLTLNRGKGGS